MFSNEQLTLKNQYEYYIIILISFYFKKKLGSVNFKDDLINDLDFDPMDLKLLIKKIEVKFKVFIYDEELAKIKSISDIANLVFKKKYPELSVTE